MLFVCIIFCLISGTFTCSVKFGLCPWPKVEPVDLERYAGEWHEYMRSKNNWNFDMKCDTSFFEKPDENGITTMYVTGIPTIGGNNSTLIGKAANNNYNLGITFHFPVLGTMYREYWVLETDYDNYSICWICQNYGLIYIVRSYVFTRKRFPKMNIEKISEEVYKKYGLSMVPMVKMNQTGCPTIYTVS